MSLLISATNRRDYSLIESRTLIYFLFSQHCPLSVIFVLLSPQFRPLGLRAAASLVHGSPERHTTSRRSLYRQRSTTRSMLSFENPRAANRERGILSDCTKNKPKYAAYLCLKKTTNQTSLCQTHSFPWNQHSVGTLHCNELSFFYLWSH